MSNELDELFTANQNAKRSRKQVHVVVEEEEQTQYNDTEEIDDKMIVEQIDDDMDVTQENFAPNYLMNGNEMSVSDIGKN